MDSRYLIISELKKWGFKFPELNSSYDDLQLINQYRHALQGISTQIGILNNELKEEGKKETQSLIKQMQIVAIGLGYSYRLDSKIITVAEWIEMCKMLEEKSKLN